jgi:hypothetical protein
MPKTGHERNETVKGVTICDYCEIEAGTDSYIDLPKGWITVREEEGSEEDTEYIPDRHFCSVDHHAKWMLDRYGS